MPAAEAETDTPLPLKSIDLLARQGWILNCGYKVQGDTVDKVTDEIGKPDSSDYVARPMVPTPPTMRPTSW